MSEPRRFNRRQHVALYLGAGGKCVCGADLEPGWHADHIQPHSRGGATKATNGQALCPSCNLKKGSSLYVDKFKPRKFQSELVRAVLARVALGERVTVAEVSPGSGKTLGYQAAAIELMRRGLIDFVAVYAPRVVLAKQAEIGWRHHTASGERGHFELFDSRLRLERLRHRANVAPLLPRDAVREGYVTTYSSLVTYPELHLDWAQANAGRFLLVADEAQFCGTDDGDNGTRAGKYIEEMAAFARHTILLTGTPYRADGKPLVLADYTDADESGRRFLVSHAQARYSDGIAGQYLRPFEASLHRVKVYLRNSETQALTEYDLSESSKVKDASPLAEVLRRPAVWGPIVDKVVNQVRTMQRINPEYRGLISCMEQSDAKKIAKYLQNRFPGLRVELSVSSDGAEAERALRDFKSQPRDVLVTVRKAFIGYDCPQITVVGVLTHYRDKGHLMQLVGRGLRVWNSDEARHPAKSQRCYIVTTDDEAMEEFVEYLRTEQAEGIRQRDEITCGGGPGGGTADPVRPVTYVEDAEVTSVRGVTNDADISSDDYLLAQATLDQFGPITSVSQLLEVMEQWGIKPQRPLAQARANTPKTEDEIIAELKSQAQQAIGRGLRKMGHDPSDPAYQKVRAVLTNSLNKAFGIDSTKQITTVERAREYLSYVRAWESNQGAS